MRIDLIAYNTHGKYATLFRVYVNFRRIDCLKIEGEGVFHHNGTPKTTDEIEKEYGIKTTYKQTFYYDLFTIIVPDEIVHIDEKNHKITVDFEKVKERKV